MLVEFFFEGANATKQMIMAILAYKENQKCLRIATRFVYNLKG